MFVAFFYTLLNTKAAVYMILWLAIVLVLFVIVVL